MSKGVVPKVTPRLSQSYASTFPKSAPDFPKNLSRYYGTNLPKSTMNKTLEKQRVFFLKKNFYEN